MCSERVVRFWLSVIPWADLRAPIVPRGEMLNPDQWEREEDPGDPGVLFSRRGGRKGEAAFCALKCFK